MAQTQINRNEIAQLTNQELKEAYRSARNLFYNATNMRKPANMLYWLIEDYEKEMAKRGM